MTDAVSDDEAPPAPGRHGRWTTGADGVEAVGVVVEIEDLTTPEQRLRNAEAARIRAESLVLAQKFVDAGGDDDEDGSDEARAAGQE